VFPVGFYVEKWQDASFFSTVTGPQLATIYVGAGLYAIALGFVIFFLAQRLKTCQKSAMTIGAFALLALAIVGKLIVTQFASSFF
jgi:hypothetical protein